MQYVRYMAIGFCMSVMLVSGYAWAADQKISARTDAATLDGTELVPIVQGGADRKVTTFGIAGLATPPLQGLDANFDISSGNIITGASEAKPLFVGDAGGTNGWNIYYHSNGTPTFKCVIANVEGDCNPGVQLNTGKKYQIKNSGGTVIFEVDEATGAITAGTLNADTSAFTLTLTEERHFPVATCQNATASANFDLAAANTPAPTCDTGTNTQKGYLAFDATTDESFEDSWILPTGFTGAIDVHFRWKAVATSGAVGWCAQLIRVPDAATSDPAYPAQASGNCVSDTAKGTTLQENTATISGVTCTSCAAGDHVYVKITRDANGGAVTDDMANDAFLLTYGRTWRVAH